MNGKCCLGVCWAVGLMALMLAAPVSASLILTPETDGVIKRADLGAPNCEVECVNDQFGSSLTQDDLLYKSDFDEGSITGNDSGTFKDSYSTLFSNFGDEDELEDPFNATITYIFDQDYISCPECYLAIKDGAAGYYFYDLADWNGTQTIEMQGFWDNEQGAISHVSIWGTGNGNGTPVSAPGILGLFGIGLLGLVMAARRRV